MLSCEKLYNLVFSKLGLPTFDRELMLKDFTVLTDCHSLCTEDFIQARNLSSKTLGCDNGPEVLNMIAIYNWLFDIDKHDQLKCGVYRNDGKVSFLPHFDSVLFSENTTMFYRFCGTAVEPYNMLYLAKDWLYLKQLYAIYLKLEEAVKDTSWLIHSNLGFDTAYLLRIATVLSEKYLTLRSLFLVDIPNSVDFYIWLEETFSLTEFEIDAIVSMSDASPNTKLCDLYGKVESYLECMVKSKTKSPLKYTYSSVSFGNTEN